MNNSFEDITDKLGKPKWYDENGYPRYCKYTPREVVNIYANYSALVDIECQSCGKPFTVAVSFSAYPGDKIQFPTKTDAGSFHYGDPPNHGCVGDTMNICSNQILEFWKKQQLGDWKQVKKYQIKTRESWRD